MIKFYGFAAIIISLFAVNYLDTKIKNGKYIISNYFKTELQTAQYHVNTLKYLNKIHKQSDSTTNHILQLHENIKIIAPYYNEHKIQQTYQIHDIDNHLKNISELIYFNKLCEKIMYQIDKKIYLQNYALVIEKFEPYKNDSCSLTITPINKIQNDTTLKFYYKNKLIEQNHLNDFKGNLDEIETRFLNPKTGEFFTIKKGA